MRGGPATRLPDPFRTGRPCSSPRRARVSASKTPRRRREAPRPESPWPSLRGTRPTHTSPPRSGSFVVRPVALGERPEPAEGAEETPPGQLNVELNDIPFRDAEEFDDLLRKGDHDRAPDSLRLHNDLGHITRV